MFHWFTTKISRADELQMQLLEHEVQEAGLRITKTMVEIYTACQAAHLPVPQYVLDGLGFQTIEDEQLIATEDQGGVR